MPNMPNLLRIPVIKLQLTGQMVSRSSVKKCFQSFVSVKKMSKLLLNGVPNETMFSTACLPKKSGNMQLATVKQITFIHGAIDGKIAARFSDNPLRNRLVRHQMALINGASWI